MSTPPSPGLPPYVLALLARLALGGASPWRAVAGDLGYFIGPDGATLGLFLERGEVWGLHDPSKVTGLGPFLMSHATAEVLLHGKVSADGASVLNGQRYNVVALAEDGRLIARAIIAA